MNAIEKAAIAQSVATYIIDHLLVEEPMTLTELWAILPNCGQSHEMSQRTGSRTLLNMREITVSIGRFSRKPDF